MNVNGVQFASNQMNYSKNNSMKKNQVAFQGALGDKFVRDITLMADVDANKIMKELKGTFGPKTEKVQDVIESFVDALRKMTLRGKQLEGDLRQANEQISKFPKEKQEAVLKAETSMAKSCREAIDAKNKEMEALKAETKEAKEALEKYKPVVDIKSVEEIGTVMPPKALETIKEIAEHKMEATKSMFNFLMTGQGQEEALAQIGRCTILQKAYKDGIFSIGSFKQEADKIFKENNIYGWNWSGGFALNIIKDALKSTPEGSYIASSAIKEQVRKNAMAILTPLADDLYSNTNLGSIEKGLEEIFVDTANFHKWYNLGIQKLINKHGKENVKIKRVDFDFNKSVVTIKEGDYTYDLTLQEVANQGNSSW